MTGITIKLSPRIYVPLTHTFFRVWSLNLNCDILFLIAIINNKNNIIIITKLELLKLKSQVDIFLVYGRKK